MPILQATVPNAPMTDAGGSVTPVWLAFFLALMNRTGGTAGMTGVTQQQLSAETTERQAADTAIAASVTSEGTTRQSAIAAEKAARIAGDAVLSGEIASIGAGGLATSPDVLGRMWFATGVPVT
jgi:hypothetical protein